jgi:adenine-specific DNA-methyltransferase
LGGTLREIQILLVKNFVSQISFEKTSGFGSQFLENTCDYILWFAKDKKQLKYRSLLLDKVPLAEGGSTYTNVMYADGREERLASWKSGRHF